MSYSYQITSSDTWTYQLSEGTAIISGDGVPIVTKASRKYITTKDGKKIIKKT